MIAPMTDVAVIGAGVVGCAVGLEVARRGGKCTVIDRHGEVGHGSTSASCGIIRRFYSTPTMTAMAHEGVLEKPAASPRLRSPGTTLPVAALRYDARALD